MSLVKKINDFIKEKNIPVKELMDILDVNSGIIYQIIKGRRGPPRRSFPSIAKMMGISIEKVIELAHEDRIKRIKILR